MPKKNVSRDKIEAETKTSEIEELKNKIEEKDKVLVESKNRLLRALADFENYKKRIQAEKESLVQFSNANLICELLPVLDGFERALKEAEKTKESNQELLKGIALIKRQMEDVFIKFGVEKVEALGKPFDPHFHEAVLQKESDKPEHLVIEEMQKGYLLNGRLIRPAMVIVSKGREAKSSEALAKEEKKDE